MLSDLGGREYLLKKKREKKISSVYGEKKGVMRGKRRRKAELQNRKKGE